MSIRCIALQWDWIVIVLKTLYCSALLCIFISVFHYLSHLFFLFSFFYFFSSCHILSICHERRGSLDAWSGHTLRYAEMLSRSARMSPFLSLPVRCYGVCWRDMRESEHLNLFYDIYFHVIIAQHVIMWCNMMWYDWRNMVWHDIAWHDMSQRNLPYIHTTHLSFPTISLLSPPLPYLPHPLPFIHLSHCRL